MGYTGQAMRYWLTTWLLAGAVAMADANAAMLTDMLRQYPAAQVQMVVQGEQQVATLFHPSHRPLSRGVIIAFADQRSLTLAQANQLAQHMNSYGWGMLVVAFDIPTPGPSPEADIEVAHQSHLTLGVDPARLNEQLTTLLPALLTVDDLPQGYRIVLARGVVAAQLLAPQLSADNIDALVAINPFWPEAEANRILSEQLATSPLPVLDLAVADGNPWPQATQQARAIAATRQRKSQYRQRQLVSSDSQYDYPLLATAMLDWIRAQGW